MALVCAAAVAFVGAIVLLGWAFDIERLKSVLPHLASMKVNTAIAFALAGSSLALRASERRPPMATVLGMSAAALVAAFGLLTLAEWLWRWDLRIDQMFARDIDVPTNLGLPGRMAPNTAFNFFLIGGALVLLHRDRALRLAHAATLGASIITLLAATGYAYGLTSLYVFASYTPMAVHTTACFAILALGLFAVRPDAGLLAALTSPRGGGTLARRLLLAAAVVPLALGFVCLTAYRAGAFGAEFCVALLAVSNVVVLYTLLWGGAHSLNRVDEDRLRAEESLRRDEEARRAAAHAQLILDTAPDAFVAVDSAGTITAWNPQATAIFGWSREEALGRPLTETIIPSAQRAVYPHGLHRFLDATEKAAERRTEITAMRRNGEEFLVELTLSPLRLEDGRVVFHAFLHDITQRKRAQADLAAAKASLERQTEILRSILDDMGEGVVVADERGTSILCNPAAERILGIEAGDGAPDPWTSGDGFFHPDRRTPYATDQLPLPRAIHGVASNEVELFVRNDRNPQGTLISVSGRPLHDIAGAPKRGLVVFRDITERRRQEERRIGDMTALNELGEMLQACQSVDEAYALVGQKARVLFAEQSGALFVVDSSQRLAEAKAFWGSESTLPPEKAFLIEECWALRRGHPHYVPDLADGLACRHVRTGVVTASLCVPLSAGAEALGVLTIVDTAPPASRLSDAIEDRRPLASAVARQVSLALANLRLRETLHNQSIRDPLTGLFNRRYMEESLAREMFRADRSRTPVGIIMLDVDHFKVFNDTYGHEAGDTVLRALGTLLRNGVRASDIPCRLGGEEMALILPESSLAGARERAEAILRATRSLTLDYRGVMLGGITVSLGVAAYPIHGARIEDVLHVADGALYRAKREGRNKVVTADNA